MIELSVEVARMLLEAMFLVDEDSKQEADEALNHFLSGGIIAIQKPSLKDMLRLLRPRLGEAYRRRILTDLDYVPSGDLLNYLESAAHEFRAVQIELASMEDG